MELLKFRKYNTTRRGVGHLQIMKPFREWFEENEERLLGDYAFDVHELHRQSQDDAKYLKSIRNFEDWAIGVYETEKDNEPQEFFTISQLSREDIKDDIGKRLKLTDKQIDEIPDWAMERFASKKADTHTDCCYWVALDYLVRNYFANYLAKEKGGNNA